MNEGYFREEDLILIVTHNPVFLKSGGPCMGVIDEKDGQALCEWEDDDGQRQELWLPFACLYSAVEYMPGFTNKTT